MQSKEFSRAVASLRKHLPKIAFGLLVFTYMICAVAGAIFLSKLLTTLGGWGVVLAIGVSVSIQAVRGTIVFFKQLNPDRPALSAFGSKLTAIVLGLLAVLEIIGLCQAAGLHFAVSVSLSILMLAGIVIEISILNEVQHATNAEFFGDPAKRKQLEDTYRAEHEFQNFLDELQNLTFSTTPSTAAAAPTATIPSWLWIAIGKAPSLTENQTKAIFIEFEKGTDQAGLMQLISDFSNANLKSPVPNGNGVHP